MKASEPCNGSINAHINGIIRKARIKQNLKNLFKCFTDAVMPDFIGFAKHKTINIIYIYFFETMIYLLTMQPSNHPFMRNISPADRPELKKNSFG